MGRLQDQVAIVTGGGRGIGREICGAFAAEGALVAVVARTEDQVSETVRRIVDDGGWAIGVGADVTDLAAVEAMVERVESELGPVALLVNNAGSNSVPGPLAEADPIAWWRDVAINLLGPFHTCRTVLPRMLARGEGRIINMTGAGRDTPRAYLSAYGSSKAAVVRLTETLDRELGESGVRAFSMSPGLVRTAMNEALITGGAMKRWFPDMLDSFDHGRDVSPTMAGALAMEIASGRLDELRGRLFDVTDNLEEVLAQKDRILAEDLKTLRIRNLT